MRRILFTLSLLLLLTGCGGRAAPASAPETLVQRVGGATVSLTLAPAPPAGDTQETFTLSLTRAGRPLAGETVFLNAGMVTMGMGSTHWQLQPTGPGRYQGRGRFPMAGEWRVRVTAGGPRKLRASFYVVVN